DLVQEIAAACKEQAYGAAQVNTSMNQLNQVTQQNASSSEELAATSEEMSAQAEQLQQAVSFFRLSSDARPAASTSFKQKPAPQPKKMPASAKAGASTQSSLADFETF